MSFLAASVASSATSQSINSGSLSFNPIITLESPEAQIRTDNRADQATRLSDLTTTSEARATAAITPFGLGGQSGAEGFAPLTSLFSNRAQAGGEPLLRGGDLSGFGDGGLLSGSNGLLLLGALAVGVFFLARKFV